MAAVHRKPLPLHQQHHPHQNPHHHLQPAHLQPQFSQERLHSRTRTNSSSVMPSSVSPAYSMTTASQQPSPQPRYQDSRRTMSNATSSTSSTNPNLNRVSTCSNSTQGGVPRRSTSSRSTSSISPTSYVALMRKQKATVWCDRAQHEDPRILVAQRQAKMRAAADIAGGGHYAQTPRTSSSTGMVGGVRSKIRHHGAPKASAYNAAALGGAGVPMRLSATEVDEGDSDEESRYATKTGSGRNSIGSGRRGNTYASSGMYAGKGKGQANGSTPPGGGSPVDSIGELAEDETPVPSNDSSNNDYFNRAGGNGGSGSSGEAEEKFGGISGLPQSTVTAEQQVQQRKNNADDLRRRGSVDERTSTMSGVRLFIANPDFSD